MKKTMCLKKKCLDFEHCISWRNMQIHSNVIDLKRQVVWSNGERTKHQRIQRIGIPIVLLHSEPMIRRVSC